MTHHLRVIGDDMFVKDASESVVHALGGAVPTRQQWDAITAPLEPCVLIAGAGSGKTAVMAARIVWLITEGHAKATEILGLTFTNKAAANLLARVRRAIEPLGLAEGEEPTVMTYHAFAASIIADYGLRAGLEPGASLLSDAQAWQLCAELFSERTYEHVEVRSMHHVSSVRHLAGECADHLIDPDEVIAADERFIALIDEKGKKVARDVVKAARERTELCEVVKRYSEVKRSRHLLDYGDQISIACELAADERVANDFRSRFTVALLDEYQDTNHAQAEMLRRLMPLGYPLMAVGDPDQNIYAWRGASLANLLQFAHVFPLDNAGSPAHSKPLEVNFRSGARILALANQLIEAIPEARRPRDKTLVAFHPDGEVDVMLVADQGVEADRIVAEALKAHHAGTPWGEIAILCRKKRLFSSIVEAFRNAQVPLEVFGLGGLMKMPEVTDVVAMLRVLEDPLRNVSLARILRGPRWRIGHRDLALIARHAAGRNREIRDALSDLESPGDVAFSLAEALEYVGEIDGLSDTARERIAAFAQELNELRRHTGLPLADLAAQALDAVGVASELRASSSPAAPSALRNLANFMDRIAAFEPLDGEPTLGALIEWLDAMEDSDEEIEAAQPTDSDSVKLMTIHQAKGLEYDVVFLPGMAAGERSKIFPDTTRQANPATSPRYLPFEFRGDKDVLPQFMGNLSGFKAELEQRAMEEERRLLYVAVTRARKRLVVSAAHWYEPAGWGEALRNPMGPSVFFDEIRAFPDANVLEEVELPPENPLIERRAMRAQRWPLDARLESDPLYPNGLAAAVEAARAAEPHADTLFAPEPPQATLAAPKGLSTTSLVTYARCPKRFYWSHVRPLPRRSSAASRIGTVFHAWLEQTGKGQLPLLDAGEFTEREPGIDSGRLARLRDVFGQTRFSGVTPARTEQAFALVVGEVIIQGRIDAIFEDEDGRWEIVDWKTGRAPQEVGAERVQLDLYALAAQQIWGKRPEDIRLTFLYLGDELAHERSFDVEPAEVLRARVLASLTDIADEKFEPSVGGGCHSCDFLRDCAAGASWVRENPRD